MRRFISVLLLITVLFSFVTIGVTSVSAGNNTLVTLDEVRLRSSAKITSDNVITTLDKGESLTLLADSTKGWAYVSRLDGTKGYCSINYLKVGDGSLVTMSGITTEEVNFRKGPSTDYDSIKLLSKNTDFTVVDNTSEYWVKAKVGSTTGYIYRTYTELAVTFSQEEEEYTPSEKPNTPDWFSSSALDSLISGNSSTDNTSSDFYLSDTSVTLEEGEYFTLSVYTLYGTLVSSAVTYKSSDTSVATVTKNGVIKGISTGNAEITAVLDGAELSDVCTVTVTPSTTEPAEQPLVLSDSEIKVYNGNSYHLSANMSVSWKTSDKSVVSVSNGIITAKSVGTATITAYTSTQSVDCIVNVKAAPSGISINSSAATVTVGKTYYNGASGSSSLTWTSSDPSIATVENGFITGVSKGKAVITVNNSSGTKTCLVTVKDAEPVRFAYSYPNTAAIGETITLYAITDKSRTGVKFELTVGSKTVTVNATDKITDGNSYIWSGTTSISSAGTFNVTAYSKQQGDWQTCSVYTDDAKTTVFVRTTSDLQTETMEYRRASDDLIELLASFEGYSSTVYFDTIANNIPTIGYGKVIYLGDSFYNEMSKKEAFAYLVQTVNNDGYTKSVNNYLDKYNIYRNQQQFDALVSFTYNLGSNILAGDSDFHDIFTAPKETDGSTEFDAYINTTNVNFRQKANTASAVLSVLDYGTKLTLIETEPVDNWYYVSTEDGTKGYVYADYVSKGVLSTSDKHYLSDINQDDFIKLMLQYHHAGVTCVKGLLNRRVDELDVFFYGEYLYNGSKNVNNFKFTCGINSSTSIS